VAVNAIKCRSFTCSNDTSILVDVEERRVWTALVLTFFSPQSSQHIVSTT